MSESIVIETYFVWMRKMPRFVLLLVSGSPRPASPLETSVVYTGVVPSYATSTCFVMLTSIHFSPFLPHAGIFFAGSTQAGAPASSTQKPSSSPS